MSVLLYSILPYIPFLVNVYKRTYRFTRCRFATCLSFWELFMYVFTLSFFLHGLCYFGMVQHLKKSTVHKN